MNFSIETQHWIKDTLQNSARKSYLKYQHRDLVGFVTPLVSTHSIALLINEDICEEWKQMKEKNKVVIDNFLLRAFLKTNGHHSLIDEAPLFLAVSATRLHFFFQKQSTNCSTQSTSAVAQPKKDKRHCFSWFLFPGHCGTTITTGTQEK